MNSKDLENFRKLLLEKREELLEDIGQHHDLSLKESVKDSAGTDATYSTHMADQGTDAQEREKAFYIASRDEKYLRNIDAALDRIENGTFGICLSCGEEIPKERLEAVPITQHCIACKEKNK
ncbi:TraR/DksA C4-type zinc finger protein [candidate division KSB1 bacterium]|nr:TraR/DksA C4-type zinc finger protein [candidate division KSB1 bacterium]